jgi:large subunit ribosomal protein L16
MGKGKGNPEGFVAEIFQGRMLFEVDAATEEIAREALRKGGTKLSVKTKIVARR